MQIRWSCPQLHGHNFHLEQRYHFFIFVYIPFQCCRPRLGHDFHLCIRHTLSCTLTTPITQLQWSCILPLQWYNTHIEHCVICWIHVSLGTLYVLQWDGHSFPLHFLQCKCHVLSLSRDTHSRALISSLTVALFVLQCYEQTLMTYSLQLATHQKIRWPSLMLTAQVLILVLP